MKDLLKAFAFAIVLGAVAFTSTYFAVVLSGTSLVLDSLGSNPGAANSLYQSKFFTKPAPEGGIGLYRLYRSGVKRIDTSFATERTVGYEFGTWSTVDSSLVFEAPLNWTIDSIRILQSGASAITFNAKRVRSGTSVDLLSSNYAVTTSVATPTGLQNNTLQVQDQVWVIIRAITGTATRIWIQFNFHVT